MVLNAAVAVMGEGGKQECAGGYVKRSRIVTGAESLGSRALTYITLHYGVIR